ncbi:MAG: DNA-binding domain-containing protein [Gammaproteobacteria bacterium]
MHSLRELQLDVMQAVLDARPELAAPYIADRGIAARLTLDVYANTARSNFTDSLIASFPVVRRLVGEDYFRQLARGCHARHPSISGDLQFAGAEFAQFLAQAHGAGEYLYLGDVAHLEWLIQETLLAAEHAPFDPAKLQTVPPNDYDALVFRLHPSVRLFTSEFPCVAIWQANAGDAEPPLIDLGSGPDRVLTIRVRGQLEFHRLSLSEQAFLEALRAEESFAAAIARGVEGGGEFDAAAALRRFVLAGAIVDFH